MIVYIAENTKTEETLEANFQDELLDMIEYESWEDGDYHIYKQHTCRGDGCESVVTRERHDAYGITTGHYCDKCYKSNYPYRKDRYPTQEHHGYGERLDEDY
jgi:hypothetical protein